MQTIDKIENEFNPMSVGDWVLVIFLTGLPIIGLILLFVWAFSDNQNQSKSNYAKAMLIWYAIGIALVFVFVVFFGGLAALISANQ